MSKWVDKIKKDLDTKMNQNDNIRIMRYFDRFAPYEELKDLYEKCLPPIRRFEN